MKETDKDCPPLRTALAELGNIVASQLFEASATLHNAHGTPWQCIALASRLDDLRYRVDAFRKEVAKLNPGATDE